MNTHSESPMHIVTYCTETEMFNAFGKILLNVIENATSFSSICVNKSQSKATETILWSIKILHIMIGKKKEKATAGIQWFLFEAIFHSVNWYSTAKVDQQKDFTDGNACAFTVPFSPLDST